MLDQRFMTHLPALFAALLNSEGPVLEIGAGFGSTPMLRDFCRATKRPFTSLEPNPHWALAMDSDCVNEFEDYAKVQTYGVVFVDHAPEQDRIRVANLFRDRARFVLIHDWSSADTYGASSDPLVSFPDWKAAEIDARFFPSTLTLSMGDIPF